MHPLALAESGWVWVGAGSRPAGLRRRMADSHAKGAALAVRWNACQGREGGVLPNPFCWLGSQRRKALAAKIARGTEAEWPKLAHGGVRFTRARSGEAGRAKPHAHPNGAKSRYAPFERDLEFRKSRRDRRPAVFELRFCALESLIHSLECRIRIRRVIQDRHNNTLTEGDISSDTMIIIERSSLEILTNRCKERLHGRRFRRRHRQPKRKGAFNTCRTRDNLLIGGASVCSALANARTDK